MTRSQCELLLALIAAERAYHSLRRDGVPLSTWDRGVELGHGFTRKTAASLEAAGVAFVIARNRQHWAYLGDIDEVDL
jgi:hypothetical protein